MKAKLLADMGEVFTTPNDEAKWNKLLKPYTFDAITSTHEYDVDTVVLESNVKELISAALLVGQRRGAIQVPLTKDGYGSDFSKRFVKY